MFEEQILNEIAIDAKLARLPVPERWMMVMLFAYECPDDYDGPWPATMRDVGRYVGIKYDGAPWSEGRVRTKRELVLEAWRST